RINRKHAPSYALFGVALSKLNDPDNASRAYAYSLKLDPVDPVALLNYGIFQANTGVSPSQINATMQQFHQCYAERAASATNQRELDTSMLEIATKLGYPAPPPAPPPDSKSLLAAFPPPPFPILSTSTQPDENNVRSSSPPPAPPTVFSPSVQRDEDLSKQPSEEIP
ncbi:unnamed protein product, partial [Adineta steineri]